MVDAGVRLTPGQRYVVGLLTFLGTPFALLAVAGGFGLDPVVTLVAFLTVGGALLFVRRARYVGGAVLAGTLATLAFLLWLGSQLAGVD